MTHDIEERILVASPDEIRELERRVGDRAQLDALMREAAELCVQAHSALASSLAAEHPRLLAEVVLARYKGRWRSRLLLWGIFVPLGVLVLALLGSAVVAVVTAFIWRP